MKAIVCVNEHDWGIGLDNHLLYSIPEDMAYFRSKTYRKAVVYGRRTLLSFPDYKPLCNRTNIILSSDKNNIPEVTKKSCHYYCYLQWLQRKVNSNIQDLGIAGINFNNIDDLDNLEVRTLVVLLNDINLVKDAGRIFGHSENDIFVCGGASIYKQLLPLCNTAYVTKVYCPDTKSDTYFPNLDKDKNWTCSWKSDLQTSTTGIKYKFHEYTRIIEDSHEKDSNKNSKT